MAHLQLHAIRSCEVPVSMTAVPFPVRIDFDMLPRIRRSLLLFPIHHSRYNCPIHLCLILPLAQCSRTKRSGANLGPWQHGSEMPESTGL
jgi:hypothetical protein